MHRQSFHKPVSGRTAGPCCTKGKMTMEKEKTAITEKYTMTVPEASAYFGIGQKKLRRLCENHTIDSFAVYSGNRYLIIRTKFEEFLQQASEI